MAESQTIPGAFPGPTDVAVARPPARTPRSNGRERELPHYTLEEMMPLGELQDIASGHLKNLLKWQFREEGWYIPLDLLLRHPAVPTTPKMAPDVAVFIGVVRPEEPAEPITSWEINPPSCPPPDVVFEIASNTTWRKDLHLKAPNYAAMGVSEYYSFDPRPEAKRARSERDTPPLRGWICAGGKASEMQPDQQGCIWSPVLESYVVADGNYLRLQEASGALRLTGEEAERAAKERALVEIEAERAAKEAERAEKETERAAKERAVAENERLVAKLREMGVDLGSLTPDRQ